MSDRDPSSTTETPDSAIASNALLQRAFSETVDPDAYVPRPATESILKALEAWREASSDAATITALIVSWVTVGIVHLPAEAAILGARFALWRNAISFVLAIVMAYVVAALVPVVS